MSHCRSNQVLFFMIGAGLGAGVTLLLLPSSRRAVKRAVQGWRSEMLGPEELLHEGVEQEAGATEGGLAAARSWRATSPGNP